MKDFRKLRTGKCWKCDRPLDDIRRVLCEDCDWKIFMDKIEERRVKNVKR
jgi:DNA-directed RNA polymerase subunit RPC12/RpoP